MHRSCELCGIGGTANPLVETPDAYGLIKTLCGGCVRKQEAKRAEIASRPPAYCQLCRAQLAPINIPRAQNSLGTCNVCKDLIAAVVPHPGLVQAQNEWAAEQQRKRAMLE